MGRDVAHEDEVTRLLRVAGGKTVGPMEKNYADVVPVYDQTRYLSRKARFTSRCETKLLRSILAPFGGSDKLLVDVACGTGHFTLQVADLFGAVVGIDLTPEMLHAARDKSRSIGRNHVSFVQASATALPLAFESADVVMTTRFLHLFPREQHAAIVEGLLGIVRPGGILLVEHDGAFPEFVSWMWRVVRRRQKEYWSSYGSGGPPSGSRCIRDVGVSAPGLPTLALVWSTASQWLSRWFVMAPLRQLATFRILVYEKSGPSERKRADLGAPRVPPHGRSLAGHVQELEPDIRAQLRQRGSSLPVDAKVSVSPLRENASHRMAIVTVEGESRRLLVKGQPNHDRIFQSLESESRMFKTIGPQMTAGNPATRCPEMLSYYPDRGLMLLEFVDGHRLDTLQLGLARSSGHDFSRLTDLCGEWLARLHALTRMPEQGNPFEALSESLRIAPPWISHQDEESYDEIRRHAEALHRRFLDFKQPLCVLHGEFAPYHILVRDSAIYVVDFGSSRKGHPFEDLAFFTAFYESRLPWRRLAGAIRIDFKEEQRRFLQSYQRYSGPFDDRIWSVMRLGRIHAMVRYVTALEARGTWRATSYSRIAQPWVRRLFWNVCGEELAALKRDSARQTL